MLRFLSKRFSRSTRGKSRTSSDKTLSKPGKNILPCKIILLDGSDLSVDVHVLLSDNYLNLKVILCPLFFSGMLNKYQRFKQKKWEKRVFCK
ncbi:hypothetical protein TNCT_41321 [Trichonephila clavata]|uniref:Uncharacterized protein n=1 Tax=Trichonephila clavata TaxID=2740835 RepID=A0A8X6I388_TRICU|nr:hypothetical protein TNCT_41321 [Trichonephila clavata]